MSDSKQVTDGNSLITQEREVRAYAERQGYTMDSVWIEEGETAKTDNRTTLKAMLAYCQANVGKIQVLVVPKVDRFARQTIDHLLLKREIHRIGIRLESVGEKLEDTPSGRFMENVLAATAQFDNEVRAERCKGGMIQAVIEGRWVCTPPRGYRMTRHQGKVTIEPDPHDAPLIVGAFERLASGKYRPREARAWLARQGISLGRSQLYRLIRTKTYLGVIEMFGLSIEAKPPFVPLITKDTYYKAQDAIELRKNYPTIQYDNPDFPLRGTLQCGRCERYLIANWSKGRNARFAYYRCKNCRRTNYPREFVELHFAQELAALRPNPQTWPRTLARLRQAWQHEQDSTEKRTRAIKEQIATLTERQKRIVEKNLSGTLPDHLTKQHVEETAKKLAELEAQLGAVGKDIDLDSVLAFAGTFFTNLPSFWRSTDLQTKKRLQRYFFPNGLKYNRQGIDRTGQSGELTELKAYLRDGLSHGVDQPHKDTNHFTDANGKDLLTIFRELYAQFGPSLSS